METKARRKVCTRCNTNKLLTEFEYYVRRDNKEGFRTHCKLCVKKALINHYKRKENMNYSDALAKELLIDFVDACKVRFADKLHRINKKALQLICEDKVKNTKIRSMLVDLTIVMQLRNSKQLYKLFIEVSTYYKINILKG